MKFVADFKERLKELREEKQISRKNMRRENEKRKQK